VVVGQGEYQPILTGCASVVQAILCDVKPVNRDDTRSSLGSARRRRESIIISLLVSVPPITSVVSSYIQLVYIYKR